MGKYFNIRIENPFKTWWKARKYFKMPSTATIRIVTNETPYARKDYCAKILDIWIHDLCWKDKFRSPRHERNPLIFICFFNWLSIWIYPNIYRINEFGEKENGDMYYWEYLLNYLYYSKSLKLVDVWSYDSKIVQYVDKYGDTEEEDVKVPYRAYIPTHLFSLNKRGLKEFRKLYESEEVRVNSKE